MPAAQVARSRAVPQGGGGWRAPRPAGARQRPAPAARARAPARGLGLPPPRPEALGRAPVSAEDAAALAARAVSGAAGEAAQGAAAGAGGGALDPFAGVLVDGGVTGWQLVVGFVVGVFPFAWASYEFGKRILIQRRCQKCEGSGLVWTKGKGMRKVRCRECGGFLPWESWEKFLLGTATPGTGGPLLVPRGQEGRLTYKVPPKPTPPSEATGQAQQSEPEAAEEARSS